MSADASKGRGENDCFGWKWQLWLYLLRSFFFDENSSFFLLRSEEIHSDWKDGEWKRFTLIMKIFLVIEKLSIM